MVLGINLSYAMTVITIGYLILVAGVLLYFAYLGRRQEIAQTVPGATEERDSTASEPRT